VDPKCQGTGLGKRLALLAEQSAAALGGRRMYVETSGKEQYTSTRKFYESAGYAVEAEFPDFYDCGDPKIVYRKMLNYTGRGPKL
jgi:ribosomal protein S18 acetylase RimI-like enzyme